MSVLRLAGGFYLYHLTMERQVAAALGFTAFLVFTDFADGYFARKFNQISELGKILDPLADKVTAALAFIALYLAYDLPFWIVAVIVGRDILILMGSAILISHLPYVTPSVISGKIAVTVLSLMYVVFLIGLEPLQKPMEWLALIMIVISSAQYAYVFVQKSFLNNKRSHD